MLGAAVIDDVLGLVILAVVTGFVQSGSVSARDVAVIVLEAFAFLVGAVVVGRALAPHLARVLAGVSDTMATKLTLLLSVGLGLAWLAHAIGLAPIIGAFAAGVLLEPIFLKDFEAPQIVRELKPLVDRLPAAGGRAGRPGAGPLPRPSPRAHPRAAGALPRPGIFRLYRDAGKARGARRPGSPRRGPRGDGGGHRRQDRGGGGRGAGQPMGRGVGHGPAGGGGLTSRRSAGSWAWSTSAFSP